MILFTLKLVLLNTDQQIVDVLLLLSLWTFKCHVKGWLLNY